MWSPKYGISKMKAIPCYAYEKTLFQTQDITVYIYTYCTCYLGDNVNI